MNDRGRGGIGLGHGIVSLAEQIGWGWTDCPLTPATKNQDVSRQVGTARGLRRRDKIRAKSSLSG